MIWKHPEQCVFFEQGVYNALNIWLMLYQEHVVGTAGWGVPSLCDGRLVGVYYRMRLQIVKEG